MTRYLAPITATLVSLSSLTASAADDLRKRRIDRSTVRHQDTIERSRDHRVRVAGRDNVRVADLSDKALVRHRQMVAHMRAARRGLVGDPVVTEEVVETGDATVLVAKMTATIKNAALVHADVPELSAAMPSRRPKFRANQLQGEALDNFDALKTQLRAKPKGHPLRRAMRKGDDALLEALARGEGDIEVVTTVAIPKEVPEVTNGVLQVPNTSAIGGFDYRTVGDLILANGNRANLPGPLVISIAQQHLEEQESTQSTPVTNASGVTRVTHKTVLGDTITGGWEWETKWKFSVAQVTMSAGLSYGVGLRAPVKVKTKVSPTDMPTVGANDLSKKYEVEVTAEVLDAPAKFYEDAGLASRDVHEGNELVLFGRMYFNVSGKADLWLSEPSISFGTTFGIDESQNFLPPFGPCGTSNPCGFSQFLPASATRTQVSAGVVSGDLQLGFNVAGDGGLSFDYESYVDDKRVKSKKGGEEKWKHRLEYEREATRTIKTWPRALKKQKSVKYGYRLADFKYKWDVTITPGLQGGITVDLGLWDHRFTLGPYWFDVFEIDVGTIKLERHEGAKNVFKRAKLGTKSWSKD